ncbi:type II restriction endonuclease [Mesobaculum littorinae]|uniref:Type II restriction endonuclease n=1 Tax=Mesobaculum littorinae TaxID=2486419 RepID=A0A438ALR5_9RHOB|nr:restriction endonuclease [Mesobaculum littorinae]RVV99793.1 type II restriction endonuclease [Mesobaculum littorinae]
MTMWMVRAAQGGVFFDQFADRGLVSVGWSEAGDVTPLRSRDDFAARLAVTELAPQDAKQGASVLYRFFRVLSEGDEVVTYDPNTRTYKVGRIAGPATLTDQPLSAPALETPHVYVRPVTWLHDTAREDLSSAARNTLGSISTLFRIGEPARSELMRQAPVGAPVGAPAATPPPSPAQTGNVTGDAEEETEEETREGQSYEALAKRSVELIADMVTRLSPREMEELVAGLLRAMGYRTRVSKIGADRGQDILASRDGLGFESPRILVEVKHRSRTAITAPDLRSFIGTLRDGDRGLYVSTGGFTKDAQYEADRARHPVTLLTLEALVAELTDRYELLDTRSRALIPLTPLYWPIR